MFCQNTLNVTSRPKSAVKLIIASFTALLGLEVTFQELEAIVGVSLQNRLLRRKARMKSNGATYRECQAVTKLDIISYDKKLRPIFEGIIKKHQALHSTIEFTKKQPFRRGCFFVE